MDFHVVGNRNVMAYSGIITDLADIASFARIVHGSFSCYGRSVSMCTQGCHC